MKNKKMMTMLLALGLVTATGVGASLAYMTDNTGELENKFTFANGIQMQLDEDEVNSETHKVKTIENDGKDGTNAIIAGETPKGNNYLNIMPGEKLHKDPTVTIKAGSPDCYVFVSVTNPSSDKLSLNINNAWKEVKKIDDDTTIYVYVDSANKPLVVNKSDTNQRLTEVFTTVTVSGAGETSKDEDGKKVNLSDIVVKSSAVQSKVDGVDNYDEVKNEGIALLEQAVK